MSVIKILRKLEGAHRPAEIFASFVKLAACAVSCGRREAEYMEEIGRWSREAAHVFAEAFAALVVEMTREPYRDRLGAIYMYLLSSSAAQWGGEFHTPPDICELMARLTLEGRALPKEGVIRVSEPACGAGAQILAFAQALGPKDLPRVRVLATDMNATACHMCYVNTTLWGIPTVVVHGNTLSGKTFQVWPNWPMQLYAPFSWRTCFRADESEEPGEFRAEYQQEPVEDAPAVESVGFTVPPPRPDPAPHLPILHRRQRRQKEEPAQLAIF